MSTARSQVSRRALVGAALLAACIAPYTFADENDKRTEVTFSGPVEVPGMVLPPGTYVFKLLDSESDRNVLQIFDKNGQHLVTTVLAVPDYRLRTPSKPIITFEERASNSPEAIKAFFYPGDNFGLQFVYPHNQAVKIARRTNQSVLSMHDETTTRDMKKTDITGVNPAGESVPMNGVVQGKSR
jgi:hypothetical protein